MLGMLVVGMPIVGMLPVPGMPVRRMSVAEMLPAAEMPVPGMLVAEMLLVVGIPALLINKRPNKERRGRGFPSTIKRCDRLVSNRISFFAEWQEKRF